MSTAVHDAPAAKREITVALAGNPNVGKTTLFNALTGLQQKVANYPGVTVEKKSGRLDLPHTPRSAAVTLIDLPGTYSLASRSPDEHVARQVLLGQIEGTPRPDVIVVVCDASNLERNLYLVTQVLELGRPAVIALTMTDIALKNNRPVDAGKLSLHLRIPVVAVQANKGIGVDELKKAVAHLLGKTAAPLALPLPEKMESHVDTLRKILTEEHLVAADQANFDAHIMLSTGDDDDLPDPRRNHPRIKPALRAALVDLASADIDPIASEIETHYNFINTIIHDCLPPETAMDSSGVPKPNVTDFIDRILTHRFAGMLIFVAIMGLVFVSIFSWAQPIMDFLQNTVVGGLANVVRHNMAEGPFRDLLADGIITGVGNVVAFVPQIALLFLFLAILEDSGYMSRAAFLMDRLMSKVGLHGKSFIPLLSGFACAVPAIMGTRVIENRRDRLATILILPLMSCSARLPVYTLMIGMFFVGALKQGLIMLAMYALGTIAAFGMAFIFKRTLLKGPAPAFILEMPPYRLPHWKSVLTTVGQRSWQFLKRAGTVIFALSVLMWAATHYPKPSHYAQDYAAQINAIQSEIATLEQSKIQNPKSEIENRKSEIENLQNARNHEVLEHSLAGTVGHAIAPVFYPLGYDWKISVGVVGAFFARETMISTMGIIYSVGDADEKSDALKTAMQHDVWPASTSRAGQPVYSPLVALSIMVFVVFCMQCLSTLAITYRETGHIGWPILMFVYMTALAWVAALVVYQGGRALGL